jgi:hypothetical protein
MLVWYTPDPGSRLWTDSFCRFSATLRCPRYGFYLHVHGHPAAVIHQVRAPRHGFWVLAIAWLWGNFRDWSPFKIIWNLINWHLTDFNWHLAWCWFNSQPEEVKKWFPGSPSLRQHKCGHSFSFLTHHDTSQMTGAQEANLCKGFLSGISCP